MAADVVFSVYELRTVGDEPPGHSLADVFAAPAYAVIFTGLFLILRQLGRYTTRDTLIDTAALFAGVGLLQWVFVISPYANSSEPTAGAFLDVLLLVGLAQLLAGGVRRNRALGLLALSVVLWVVADEAFVASSGSYTSGSWIDGFWLGAYVCWGWAALDPSTARIARPRERRRLPRLSNARLIVLALALGLAPAILLAERLSGHSAHVYAVAIGGLIIGSIVLLRLGGLVREIEASRRAERAARRDAENAHRLLVEQNARLVELDRLKDEFLSGITHELRTPLTSISGYVELLLDEEADPERTSYLDVIDRNAERLLALVSDLLLAAHLQSGEFTLKREAVDVGRLVAEAVEAARPRALAGGVELAAAAVDGSPVVVDGDAVRIAQVLDNLVSNALKFTPFGGSVTVSATMDPDWARIEVVDTGIGIPEDERGRLFQRFYRTPEAVERQIQGTGLGLYITKAIVDAHGGRIAVLAADGGRTTVRVELPKQ